MLRRTLLSLPLIPALAAIGLRPRRQTMAELLDDTDRLKPTQEAYLALRRTGAVVHKQRIVWASWQPEPRTTYLPVCPPASDPMFVDDHPESPVANSMYAKVARKDIDWDMGSVFKIPGFTGFTQPHDRERFDLPADVAVVWIYQGQRKPHAAWFYGPWQDGEYRFERATELASAKPDFTKKRYGFQRLKGYPSDATISRLWGIPAACDVLVPLFV